MAPWKKDIRKFQKVRGLVADGIIGPTTWAAIEDATYQLPPKPTKIKPFTQAQAKRFYGDPLVGVNPALALDSKGRFKANPQWRKKCIVYVYRDNLPDAAANIPNLHARLPFHNRVADSFTDLMWAWDAADLLPLIKHWNGSTVFRATRRPGSIKLSKHAFGSAFDINAAWNRMGKRPADINAEGSVLRLVDIAAVHNFYWGGHFKDGMHFEYARRV